MSNQHSSGSSLVSNTKLELTAEVANQTRYFVFAGSEASENKTDKTGTVLQTRLVPLDNMIDTYKFEQIAALNPYHRGRESNPRRSQASPS